jgi:hypothetical protein
MTVAAGREIVTEMATGIGTRIPPPLKLATRLELLAWQRRRLRGERHGSKRGSAKSASEKSGRSGAGSARLSVRPQSSDVSASVNGTSIVACTSATFPAMRQMCS